ncbi:MAG TPA: hypothetical protein VLI04_18750, partial [Nocardioidaceae bacterium]|nr:hypothetical protein [Nocardioidaceae bacterium]
TDEIRGSTAKELAATHLLAMPIGEWSLRTSDKWPEDPADDVAGPAWAGHVRFASAPPVVTPTPDLSEGIPLPSSISAVRGVR